ncbi:protein-L-isoaspartate(D-aspartate) O-methyltransferase [Aurantimonas sp. VKM B-3413]|nr:protein-L-isoaspartate(D-aspartate) O-methyltransferase [Aurantimonas sp. VKM B-3413]MCB8839350.1 protein-L-isoaspartate(D-aspartate) O-methyltransferase [Aurantimonas sp. VKM B-3413]
MVEYQLKRRGIEDEAVLAAMGSVPREAFVPEHMQAFAYEDGPLSIGGGQTISQPLIVAEMLQAARVRPGERVLDVGTGSGYGAAVAAAMGAIVSSIERDPALGERARQRLEALGYKVETRIGDGTLGLPEAAPFDAIIVAAASPGVPEPLTEQLAVGGRLVIPLERGPASQRLVRITRGEDGFREEALSRVSFVPLIGAHGRPESAATPDDGSRGK